MKYNLSALEILNFLGYCEPVGAKSLSAFETTNHITLPKTYRDFMEAAYCCPMLETSDIWTDADKLYWYYDALKERIEDECEAWEEDPQEYAEDALYQLSKQPEEAWKDTVLNYLAFGSDYGAGIVTFGLSPELMDEPDPPLFWQHEANPLTMWTPAPNGEHLSDFLLDVVLNTLAMMDYETAEEALEELGWEYTELSLEEPFSDCINAAGIDLSQVKKFGHGSCIDFNLFCCCDEENKILYVGQIGIGDYEKESVLYQISPIDDESNI